MNNQEQKELVATMNSSSEIVEYALEGGMVRFDLSTNQIISGDTTITKADIPAEIQGVAVRKIANYAFQNCKSLKDVRIAEGLVEIGYQAFVNCINLEIVELPSTVSQTGRKNSLATYTGRCFQGCTALKEVVLKEGMTIIPVGLLADIPQVIEVNIPESVTVLAGQFLRNTKVKEFRIPDAVVEIGEGAFMGTNFKAVVTAGHERAGEAGVLVLPDQVMRMGEGVFSYIPELEEVDWPAAMTVIPNVTFSTNSRLTRVKLPEGLVHMGYQMFLNCVSLEEIEIPATVCQTGRANSLATYTGRCFQGCTGLKKVILKEGMTIIPTGFLADIPQVIEVNIPESVTVLAGQFLRNTKVKEFRIPDAVVEIGEGAFMGTNFKAVVTAGHERAGEAGVLVLPNQVMRMGEGVFSYIPELEEVDWPAAMTVIPNVTFSTNSRLTRVKLPEGLVHMGYQMFLNCVSLEEIEIPATVCQTGRANSLVTYTGRCFQGCTSLKKIVLREGIHTIPVGAFANLSTDCNIVIPESLETISAQAFAYCKAMTILQLTKGIAKVGKDVFLECDNLTISFPMNYVLVNYVVENDLRHVVVDGEELISQGIVDPDNSYYQKSTTGLTLSGYLNCTLKYKISETEFDKLSDTKLRVRLPEEILVYPGSLKIDGQEYNNYTYRNHWLVVSVNRSEGLVEFSAKPEKYKTFSSIASFNYLKNGTRYDDLLGYLYLDMPKLTLNTPSVIGVKSFNISGTTIPDNIVEIFVDEMKVGQAMANKLGYYKYPVTLIMKEKSIYTIKSKTYFDNEELTVTSDLQYYPYWPEISQFKMHYWEHLTRRTVDLIAMKKNKFVYSFRPSKPITYSVGLENDEDVKQVFVCSRQDGVKKRVEAKWDKNSQMWITSDFFDDKNHSYIPGAVSVEWTPKSTFGRIPGTSETPESPEQPDPYKDIQGGLKEVADRTMTDYLKSTTLSGLDSLMELYTRQGLAIGLSPAYPFIELCKDLNDGKINIDTFEGKLETVGSLIGITNSLIAGMTGVTLIPAGYLWTGFMGTLLFTYNMYQDIIQQLKDASGELEGMQTTGDYSRLSLTLNTLANYVISFVEGIKIDIIWIKEWLENFKDEDDPEAGNEGDMEHGGNGEAKIDPRGFVYEAVTSNRLAGVVASVYCQDPVTGVPRLWNAAEYGQKNDQVTSSNGVFAWDVPEGNWQVRCKLAGYENAQSEWLPVPPPQLDVMIPMVSYAVPVIAKTSVGNGFIELEFSKYMMPESMAHLVLKDMQNQPVAYTLEYAVNETNEAGTVFAKTYRLKVDQNDKNYMVGLDEKIQSYAGVGMEALEVLV